MTVIPFDDKEESSRIPVNAEEAVAWLRKMRDGEDIRMLIGDLFMRLAADEPIEEPTPYIQLFRRLLGSVDTSSESTLSVMMDNLDYLRQYEIMSQQRQNLRKMIRETDHGWDLIRKSRERENEFREILSRRKGTEDKREAK